jgi:hypothetical protein
MSLTPEKPRRTKIRNQPRPSPKKRRKKPLPVDPGHMRLRAKVIGTDADNDTCIIEVASFHGPRRFTVDRQTVRDDSSVFVGAPLAQRDRFRLVEIPNFRQRQLCWVDVREIVEDGHFVK